MKKAALVRGSVVRHLMALTWPMILGMLSLSMFNLVDTYFVGQLGVEQLAAMGFTFPVVTLINSFALGLGIGAGAGVSRAIGREDYRRAARITTDGMMIAVFLAVVLSLVGLLTIEPVFRFLGADAAVMPYIRDYMSVWYLGVAFVVVPMVGNNAIRATGDSRSPALVMLVAGISNAIFDYLLIFGIGPFPEMGIRGAALATVIGRFLTLLVAVRILVRRERLLVWSRPRLTSLLESGKNLLQVGLPVALTRVMQPVSIGVLTALLAYYGNQAVAGFGVATRIEMLLLVVLQSFASVLAPFGGQNYGAGELCRVRSSLRLAVWFSIGNGILVTVLVYAAGPRVLALFTDDAIALQEAVLYLRIAAPGYVFYGILQSVSSLLNVTDRPGLAAGLNLAQMFAVCVPLALVLRVFWGSAGIYLALSLSWLVLALCALFFWYRHLRCRKTQSAGTPVGLAGSGD